MLSMCPTNMGFENNANEGDSSRPNYCGLRNGKWGRESSEWESTAFSSVGC